MNRQPKQKTSSQFEELPVLHQSNKDLRQHQHQQSCGRNLTHLLGGPRDGNSTLVVRGRDVEIASRFVVVERPQRYHRDHNRSHNMKMNNTNTDSNKDTIIDESLDRRARHRQHDRRRAGGELGVSEAAPLDGRLIPICYKRTLFENLSFVTPLLALWLGLLLVVGLTVLVPSHGLVEGIKLQPEGKEKFYWSGDNFVITCQNNNNIKNVKMRWFGPDGGEITTDRKSRIHAESSAPHGHRLVVINATSGQDEGLYRCELATAGDAHPRQQDEFHLKLIRDTSFGETPSQVVLAAGQEGVLTCHVEFDPAATGTVSWLYGQQPVEHLNPENGSTSFRVAEFEPRRGYSRLHITPLTRERRGRYTCHITATTDRLSRIADHHIELDVHYGPSFDRAQYTVWVERSHQQHQLPPAAGRIGPMGALTPPPGGAANLYARARGRHNKPSHRGEEQQSHNNVEPISGPNQTTSGAATVVRVELRCSVESNPPSTIIWNSPEVSNYLISHGDPNWSHILEPIQTEQQGHLVSSTLIVGYQLEADWQHRRDTYVCSASNKLGKASKTFDIEQGDPPPALRVPSQVGHYEPASSQFTFTLLPSETLINPPVDSLRIRADPMTASSDSGQQQNILVGHQSASSLSRGSPTSSPSSQSGYRVRQQQQQQQQQSAYNNELASVQWNISGVSSSENTLISPKNYTVNLGRLPSGPQRLFLEAHNAVGWSPNATYLGEFYIVSSASSVGNSVPMMIILIAATLGSNLLLTAKLCKSW